MADVAGALGLVAAAWLVGLPGKRLCCRQLRGFKNPLIVFPPPRLALFLPLLPPKDGLESET